jgi:transposase
VPAKSGLQNLIFESGTANKNAIAEGAVIVFVDEASFRQTPTLRQTWAPCNKRPQIPTRGEGNTRKVLGAVELRSAKYVYRHQTDYFNHQTCRSFVEDVVLPGYYRRGHRIYLIQDNASYHRHPEVWGFFKQERSKLEVLSLPKYSPELNAQEPLWKFTRSNSIHNRFFETPADLCSSLFHSFADMQRHPEKLPGILRPFS